jgi:ubiquinone/menaquinone biosynthesis C-methylase UbiE
VTAEQPAVPAPGAVWKDESVVSGFIDERRKLIPLFDVQEELARRLIVRGGRDVRRFADLGAGDGGFAELLLDLYPDSSGILVDFSAPMLEQAARRLDGKRGRWEIVRGDLAQPAWRDGLPAGERFDAVVSRLAIHHLPDDRKRALYREAFDLLAPRGLFLNWEHVETGGLAEGLFDEFFRERLLEAEREREHPRAPEEVLRAYDDAADDDILCDPETQCAWLREIGFENVDVYFKLPGLAIFGGERGR